MIRVSIGSVGMGSLGVNDTKKSLKKVAEIVA